MRGNRDASAGMSLAESLANPRQSPGNHGNSAGWQETVADFRNDDEVVVAMFNHPLAARSERTVVAYGMNSNAC